MAWTSLLLVLLSHCTGSLSQPVLTQPPSLSASPGASARLTCALSSGFSVGGYGISWYQQKPGSTPRYLLYHYSSTALGTGVPSRFSGSKDTSANAGVLHISGLQPEDEADYYCLTYHNNNGTQCYRPMRKTVLGTVDGYRTESVRTLLFTLQTWSLSCSPGLPAGGGGPAPHHREDKESFLSGEKELPRAVIRLTCALSSGFSVGSYAISWYQQKPGSRPRYLLWYYSDSNKHQGSGVPSRFSGSKDTSANAGVLHISGLQPEDEADYYCVTGYSSTLHSDTGRRGSGTKTRGPTAPGL
ncbi:Immunoglobulin omega chain [Tupaia chinensis]|nr:Immunoglobulin omega chain [Tupaia chinensis]